MTSDYKKDYKDKNKNHIYRIKRKGDETRINR